MVEDCEDYHGGWQPPEAGSSDNPVARVHGVSYLT